MNNLVEAPIYCKDCNSRNTWERQPGRDIKSVSGATLWERWVCKICGHTTILPTENIMKGVI